MFAIEAKNVVREFKKRNSPYKLALDNVNIEVERGSFYGLLGPNGAGKSTLIKIFTTLLLPTSGSVSVLGHDVFKEENEIRWKISLVTGGEMSGYGLLSVYEQLTMFAMFNGLTKNEAKHKINQLLEIVGLDNSRDVKLNELSTGMRQKMNLVRGLMTDPEILFLDEPTLGLDVEIALDVRRYLKEWIKEGNGERTILLTTHYMQEADDMCEKISIIDDGKILHTGTSNELKNKAEFTVKYICKFLDNIPHSDLEKFERVEINKDTVSIELDSDKNSESIFNSLKNLNGIVSVNRYEPTLEDAFLNLTGKKLNESL